MKTQNKRIHTFAWIAAFGLCTLATHPLQAQIAFPDDVEDEAPAAPIDGLLGLGIAAGVFYGYRKIREQRKE